MKEKIYYFGAIALFIIYYIGSFVIANWLTFTIPLLVSNIALFLVWMNYVDKKWKESDKVKENHLPQKTSGFRTSSTRNDK